MTSEYTEIYSRFYMCVTDYKLAGLSERVANELLNGYLRRTSAMPMVRRLFETFAMDDDIEEIEYTLRVPLDDDSDKDFVEEILALGMILNWVSPQYHNVLNTSQLFTNSEQRFYSQSAHMSELKAMYEKAQSDLKKLIRDRGYSLSVINGVES